MKKIKWFLLLITLNIHTPFAIAQTWVYEGLPGISAGMEGYSRLAIDPSGAPYVAFIDLNNGHKPTIMKFNGGGWVAVGSGVISDSPASCISMDIDHAGTPYVAFSRAVEGGGYGACTVMKFSSGSWVPVGSINFSPIGVEWLSLALDSSGTPYVAFSYAGTGISALAVMKYIGSSWVVVGGSNIATNYSQSISIAIDKEATPYVIYQDWGAGTKATVKKFDGINWLTVGSPGFSAGVAESTSIAIDTSGVPYVAYEDGSYGNRVTVMKYNGGAWSNVGSAGLSAGEAYWTSLALDGAGVPYVGYTDVTTINGGATVMKFNGSGWTIVGAASLNALGTYSGTSIAIDSHNTPFVAYVDGNYGGRISVVMLDTALSAITGNNILCTGDTTTLSDAKNGGIWSSSNPAIVSVSTNGLLTGLTSGTATISYTKAGYAATYKVTIDSIVVPPFGFITPDSICAGDTIWLDNNLRCNWLSLDSSVAIVTGYGFLTGIAPGSVGINCTVTNQCGTGTTVDSFYVFSCTNGLSGPADSGVDSITVFPNPATNILTVSHPTCAVGDVHITNVLGQMVNQKAGLGVRNAMSSTRIDVSELPPGMYLVWINGIEVRRFVKE